MSNIMESKVYILRVQTWLALITLHLGSGAWAVFCFRNMATKKEAAILAGLFFIITALIIIISVWPEKNRLKMLLLFCFLQAFVFGTPMLISALVQFESPAILSTLKTVHKVSELNYLLILGRLVYQGLFKRCTTPLN